MKLESIYNSNKFVLIYNLKYKNTILVTHIGFHINYFYLDINCCFYEFWFALVY